MGDIVTSMSTTASIILCSVGRDGVAGVVAAVPFIAGLFRQLLPPAWCNSRQEVLPVILLLPLPKVGVLLLLLPLFLLVILLLWLRLLLPFQVSMCALLLELRANIMSTSLHQPQRPPPVLILHSCTILIRCVTLTRCAMLIQHRCSDPPGVAETLHRLAQARCGPVSCIRGCCLRARTGAKCSRCSLLQTAKDLAKHLLIFSSLSSLS